MAPPDEMVMVPFCSVLGFEQPPLITTPPLPESPVSLGPAVALAEALAAVLALPDGALVLLAALLAVALAAELGLPGAELALAAALLGAVPEAGLDGVAALLGAELALLDCAPLVVSALLEELPCALEALGLMPFAESLGEQASPTDESRATRGTAVRARIMIGSCALAPAF